MIHEKEKLSDLQAKQKSVQVENEDLQELLRKEQCARQALERQVQQLNDSNSWVK